MAVDTTIAWRGGFTSAEANALHAEAFETRVFSDEEWDWRAQVEAHSLGWVTARDDGELVGFVNVLWDGLVHAWLQDVMVSRSHRGRGIGEAAVARAVEACREAGCEYVHVDFDPELTAFYLDRCGFTPVTAGLMELAP